MQVLSSGRRPGLVPTSQEAGGLIHSNDLAMTAQGSQPGFDGGLMVAPTTTDAPLPLPAALPVDADAETGLPPGLPAGHPSGGGGRYSAAQLASAWQPTPSAG